ncbi:hypothetical protein B0H17DRAFT_1148969 [Mycena rosella]|uniref:Uncharacterized protein n=1 Tax=Mycena rosella TaxID=1033263 RepID=A0AAD7C6N6_MYCRO|nr:hypothetical protein B0H17DRAFT_1148969 [Mycena rosella]
MFYGLGRSPGGWTPESCFWLRATQMTRSARGTSSAPATGSGLRTSDNAPSVLRETKAYFRAAIRFAGVVVGGGVLILVFLLLLGLRRRRRRIDDTLQQYTVQEVQTTSGKNASATGSIPVASRSKGATGILQLHGVV